MHLLPQITVTAVLMRDKALHLRHSLIKNLANSIWTSISYHVTCIKCTLISKVWYNTNADDAVLFNYFFIYSHPPTAPCGFVKRQKVNWADADDGSKVISLIIAEVKGHTLTNDLRAAAPPEHVSSDENEILTPGLGFFAHFCVSFAVTLWGDCVFCVQTESEMFALSAAILDQYCTLLTTGSLCQIRGN